MGTDLVATRAARLLARGDGQATSIESLTRWVGPSASVSLGDMRRQWADERCQRAWDVQAIIKGILAVVLASLPCVMIDEGGNRPPLACSLQGRISVSNSSTSRHLQSR